MPAVTWRCTTSCAISSTPTSSRPAGAFWPPRTRRTSARWTSCWARLSWHRPMPPPCDLAWLFRARPLDPYFPAKPMLLTLYRMLRGLGLDIEQATNVAVDLEPRALKVPRAFCARLDVPRDVRLVATAVRRAARLLGAVSSGGPCRALRQRRSHPDFPERWLGDNSVTEGYGNLFEYLLADPAGRRPALDVAYPADYRAARPIRAAVSAAPTRHVAPVRAGAVRRRRLRGARPVLCRAVHADAGRGARARAVPGRADPACTRRYACGPGCSEAQLRQYLQKEYDEEWYRVGRAGRFLRDLWREGQKYPWMSWRATWVTRAWTFGWSRKSFARAWPEHRAGGVD